MLAQVGDQRGFECSPGFRRVPDSCRQDPGSSATRRCARPTAPPAAIRLRRLIAELHAQSSRFAELWESGAVGRHEAARKTIDHPHIGPLTLDCDVLTVAGSDLHIMIYTAEPETEDAERLALATVLGTQTLVE